MYILILKFTRLFPQKNKINSYLPCNKYQNNQTNPFKTLTLNYGNQYT